MKFLRRWKYTIQLGLLLLVVVLALVGLIVKGAHDCDGDYVRGVVWFKCIEKGGVSE